jgi:ribonuclease I
MFKTKKVKNLWVLTIISNIWRLGELLSKQRTDKTSFMSLSFMPMKRNLKLIQGVGSFTGTTPAAKYWTKHGSRMYQCTSASFDYYMLSETWDPTFCKGQACKAKFTLHGLWPQNNTGPQPSTCPTQYKLDIEQVYMYLTILII